jgi:molybdopterin/thiamine biosynthesis adenylyltransferase
MSSHHLRFRDCPWYSEQYPRATVGGVGGIGSWLTFFLGRIGVPMMLYDFDTIDYTNMGGQLFTKGSVGQRKTAGVIDNIQNYSGPSNIITRGRYDAHDPVDNVLFTCFDNMKAREQMAQQWYRQNKMQRLSRPAIFIDGRMTVESFQIYAVTPNRYEEYMDKYMFDDSRVHEPLCSMKATSHIGAMIGSMMTQCFTNYMTNFNTGLDIRELPLRKTYEAAFLDFI